MRILIDTNICLDILQNRPGLYDSSKNALLLASDKKCKMFITTATVMDIYGACKTGTRTGHSAIASPRP